MKKLGKLLFFAAITALLTCLLCVALSATQYSGNCGKNGNNVTWSLDTETGVLKIEGKGAMADFSSGGTPWNNYNSSINSVEISNGVTTIGKNSIKYTNAVSISMPESITRIESAGFEGNEKLLSIVIPANVEYIGDHAFNNCTSLENITFEKNSKLTEISSAAFGYCKKLCSLEIPASVTSIATSSSGFVYGNYSMTSLTVAEGNTVYHSKNNCIIETAAKALIAGCKTSTIPTDGSVVVIESGAFDRSNISSIVIPESVTDIKMWTFGSCNSLQKITILNKDANIANDVYAIYAGATIVGHSGSTAEAYATKYNRTFVVFKNIIASGTCGENLTWALDEDGLLTIEGSGAMNNYPWHDYRSSIKSVEITEGATDIGDNAFSGCKNLAVITMPSSLTSIGRYAFANCTNLSSITIPQNVTDIGECAFQSSGLTSVTFENMPTRIENKIFFNCKNLVSITIPDTVIDIGNGAFALCTGLTSVFIPESVESIGDEAFKSCSNITEVSLPAGLVKIGTEAFGYCSKLESVSIPESVTSIGAMAFYRTNLTFAKDSGGSYLGNDSNPYYALIYGNNYNAHRINESTVIIANKAFDQALGTEIYIPNSVTHIGDNAFFFSKFDKLSFGENSKLVSIGNSAFASCLYLSGAVKIPESVTYIGSGAFGSCNISSINIPKGITEIKASTFYNCKLKSVVIPYGVTSFGNKAFAQCLFENINVPKTLINIGQEAFMGCESLKSIKIYEDVENIDKYAFKNCTNLEKIIIFSKDSVIFDDKDTFPENTVIYGYKDSTAEAYATKYNRKFVVIIANGECGENLEWMLDETGLLTIEGTGAMRNYGADYVSKSSAPWRNYRTSVHKVEIARGVTSIGDFAFYYCNNLSGKVEIPESVTYIGDDAFSNCRNILSIEIPCSVTSIRTATFYGCERLAHIEIPNSVTSIGSYAFGGCYKLTSITIPSSVTSIGDHAFYYCTSLASITIPDSVTSIGDYAFSCCTRFTSITIPSSVTSIGDYIFSYCRNLTGINVDEANKNYKSIDGILFTKDEKALAAYPAAKSGIAYAIPSSVTSIGNDAFAYCSSLSFITIPDSVTSIGRRAFFGCISLTRIKIPGSVAYIGDKAFNGGSLTSITIFSNNVVFNDSADTISATATIYGYSGSTAEAYATKYNRKFVAIIANGECGESLEWMLDETGLLTIEGTGTMDDYPSRNIPWYEYRSSIKSVEIRDGVTSIGSHAFSVCNSLMSITIPDSVTRIGNGAFAGCDDLTSITFGENSQLTSIGDNAFDLCCIITGISIPNNVISIGSRAFQSCRSLTDITIPNSVISIGDNAFYDCSSLTSINVDESNKNYKSINGVLFTKDEEILIAYPAAKSETTYIIPSGVTSIRSSAFFGCSSLTSVEIPSSVTSIGSSAFYNCSSLTSIEIPSGVTSIKANTFSGCNSLTSVKIPTSVTSIEDYAFRGCDFTSIEIPNSVTNIGLGAFYACGNLTSIEIPSGVTSIRRDTFTGCGLTSVTISNCVTSIEDYAFSGCTSLTSIEIPSSVISIGMYTFEGCSSLVSITMHSGVTYIGCGAFYGCSSLTSITIPDSILSIEWRTFSVCDSLVSITILSKDTVIYDSADAIPEAATIYGYSGSTAEAYATKYNRKFVAIDKYNSMNAGATLNENITMNFIGTALTKEDVDGNDFKMTFVMNGSKTSVSPVEKNGKYTFPFAGIAPQCMNDEISYEMTMNGAVVKQGSISVSGYLKQLIEKKPDNMTDAKFKAMSTLVSDMLNYGSAAQAYTGHGTDSLLNENYYDDIVNKYTELESTDKALSGAAPAGAKFTNVGVRFDNVNKVFFRFTADDISKVIITINGVAYGQDKFVKTGDKYTVYSEDVLASKFDTVYTAILTYIGTDEKQMMTYSVKSFAYSFQNKRGEDGKLTAEAVLARATYTYGVSARAYENAE